MFAEITPLKRTDLFGQLTSMPRHNVRDAKDGSILAMKNESSRIFFFSRGITCDKDIAETCRRQRQATSSPASKKFRSMAGTKVNGDSL